MLKTLKTSLNDLNISLSDKQLTDISFFLEEIYKNNKLFNLTGYKTKELIVEMLGVKSVLIANSLVNHFFNNELKVIDIGTGAGIPGLIIKIIYPNLDVYLLDSNAKKVNFIKETINKLNLSNIVALNSRVEDNEFLNKYKQSFDFVFSQAVSNIAVLNELSTQLLKINGKVIHFKSKGYQNEINFASNHLIDLGLELNICDSYEFNNYFLVNVFYNKKTEASNKYPREWSKIKKELIEDARH
ncbi:16S rRNA (guanine(527)-N(7))-methyltransferase RsmG [Mycoplasma bradburyae]|uniref:Ribosomal RNA small subunit methyltransferase G n=1 Tax=Mycoplasma bradburyae TaxID=2963128 RepID=A0AAW6HSB6_9MOLU|nr:16S rRNA (guanine(527)-N(7))-methyltransferase RsmG [Mycoplasma bradburyae]MDC4183693.1 16S rRNA (guanine(527)-N(7))-methyltransferase RsmG [Mycoplasma bradburyae]UTS70745.1 16S rRNA (guanine(527)-N(7))-methyltransferase RsmG [Mycoplasma bradburyae]